MFRKRIFFSLFGVLTVLLSLASCSKGGGPESMLVGVWKQHSTEYQFAAHSIETRNAEDVTFTFRADGTCTVLEGEKSREERYDVQGNILYVGTEDAYIVSLSDDEMVLSGGFTLMHIYGGTDSFRKFTTFKGIQIYLDNYEGYCYQKGTEWYGCQRLDDGPDGDPAGAVFYDCTYGYFTRAE